MISYGLSGLYYAPETETSYAAPKPLPGAVKINLNPVVKDINFTGLDGEEHNEYSILLGYNGTLEVASLTNDFRKDIFGYIIDSNGSIIETDTRIIIPSCAIMFQTEGNQARHCYYSCQFSRTSFDAETNNKSVKVRTFSLPVRIRKNASGQFKKINANIDSAVYQNWYKEVP